MAPNFAYVRISSVDQNEDRQFDGFSFDKWFTDRCSGKDRNRPGLQQAMEHLRAGDHLHVHSIDRLARNLQDLQNIVDELTGKGVAVTFHKENLTFSGESDPMQKLLFQVMGSFAEFERSMIRERQAEGIALAKKAGKYKGRKAAITPEQIREIKSRVTQREKVAHLALEYGVSRQTIYTALKGQK